MPLRLSGQMAVAFWGLILAASAIAQAPAPSTPSSGAPPSPATTAPQNAPPAIHVTTHLVQVNVVVEDKKGNPVTDLTKDDFALLDGNKPQQISVFSMQATHLTPVLATPPPKNQFTNRFEQQPGVPTSVTVVLFDALNTHFEDMANARQEVLKFIRQLQPQDRVAVFGLTYDLYVLQDFTNDPQALSNAVKKFATPETAHADASDPQPSDSGDDKLDAFLDSMNQMASNFYNRDRALRTAGALTAIAHYIGRLPGRKNLIWVSASFPISVNMDAETSIPAIRSPQPDEEIFQDQVDAAAQALNDANVAVYPVDARGLMGPSTFNARLGGAPFGQAARNGRLPPTGMPSQQIFATMDELADRTGGRAFYNTNDISGSIRKAIDDSRVTYTLGYYPDHGEWNGKFRDIKIKVDRPGVQVRYRRGYFAAADTSPTPVQRQFLLQDTLDSPVDSTAIGMTVTATPTGTAGAQSIHVHLQVDSQAIVLVPEADHWNASVDVLVAEWDDKNKVLRATTRTSQIQVTQANRGQWDTIGFDVQFDVPVLPSASRMRIATCDEQSGATGSVTIPIKNLTADSQ